MATLVIPGSSLVLLIGASGAGKSTFARKHFKATEVVSSDRCRALVCDDEDDQSASRDAFELVRLMVRKRLARGRLTVVDATNVQASARRDLHKIAALHGSPVVAIVFDLPENVSVAHNLKRGTRVVPLAIIRRQIRNLKASLAKLEKEGFAQVCVLETQSAVNMLRIQRIR